MEVFGLLVEGGVEVAGVGTFEKEFGGIVPDKLPPPQVLILLPYGLEGDLLSNVSSSSSLSHCFLEIVTVSSSIAY